MTRAEVTEAIHRIIQGVVESAGGDWRKSFVRDVDAIMQVMGKLSPEPKEKPQVPELPPKLLKRAKRLKDRVTFTEDQREAARQVLRDLGVI